MARLFPVIAATAAVMGLVAIGGGGYIAYKVSNKDPKDDKKNNPVQDLTTVRVASLNGLDKKAAELEGFKGAGFTGFVCKRKSSATDGMCDAALQAITNKCKSRRGNSCVNTMSRLGYIGFQAESKISVEDDIEALSECCDEVDVDQEIHVFQSSCPSVTPPWGLDRIDDGSTKVSPVDYYPSSRGEGATVFVIDTGIRTTHTEFQLPGGSSKVRGFYTANGISGSSDGNGHGTHCAGTIAGKNYGVAKDANLYAVKVLDDSGSGSWTSVMDGMDFVVRNCPNGRTTIGGQASATRCVGSMSLGGGQSNAINTAVATMVNNNIIVTVAAGNEASDAQYFSPASSISAITVGAMDSSDRAASFSNYGTLVDIFAPGVAILSSVSSSDTATASWSGTSMACPHVAGAAALILTMEPTLTPSNVLKELLKVAVKAKITEGFTTCRYSLLQVPKATTTDCSSDPSVGLDPSMPEYPSPCGCGGGTCPAVNPTPAPTLQPTPPPTPAPPTPQPTQAPPSPAPTPAPTPPPTQCQVGTACSVGDTACDAFCCERSGPGYWGRNRNGSCRCSFCTSSPTPPPPPTPAPPPPATSCSGTTACSRGDAECDQLCCEQYGLGYFSQRRKGIRCQCAMC